MDEQDLFLKASEITDAQAREKFLDECCDGNHALRSRLGKLIHSHENAGEFLQTPAVVPIDDVAAYDITTPDDSSTREVHRCDQQIATGDPMDSTIAGITEYSIDVKLSPAIFDRSSAAQNLGRLGNYRILEVLGSGAFGVVLKAIDELLDRVVAIKIMSPELATMSTARKRFLREARAAAAVRNTYVVQIYSVNEQPTPHLVMEYIPGVTVQQRIEELGPFEVQEVLRLGQQIAMGLAAAHAIGLIHRDVKPANILLASDANDQVKITDFGLARAVDDASATQSGLIAGTPMYMSPEQAGVGAIDQRADLFSLGSVLYVMLTGKAAFRAPTTLAVLRRVADDSPQPIHEIVPTVPIWLCGIVSKLQSKLPEDRYSSAQEVAELLGRCLSEYQQGLVPELPRPNSDESRPLPRKGHRRWVVATAALFTLVFVAIVILNRQNSSKSATDGSNTSKNSAVDSTVTIDLGSLFNERCLDDGHIDDVSFENGLLKLDGTGRSQHFWINFLTIDVEELTIETRLRVANSQDLGFAKLVFKPHGEPEIDAVVSTKTGEPRVNIEVWFQSRMIEEVGALKTPIKIGDWISFKLVASERQFACFVDGVLAAEIPRKNHQPGFVALSSGGWICEMQRPHVILQRKSAAFPWTSYEK